MDNTYWHQQSKSQALYPDIKWSQPEHRKLAGKLAIIGGNSHGFSSVSSSFAKAQAAGIGTIRTLLPDSLAKNLKHIWPESEFAASNKSGGFSSKALDDWLDLELWADATLISGDLSQNSETAILLEKFMTKNIHPLTLVGDSLSLAAISPLSIINHNQLLIAPSLSQLQKLLIAIRYPTALKSTISLNQLVELLHSLTYSYDLAINLTHQDQIFVAYKGEVSTTPTNNKVIDILNIATASTVWRLQQPAKVFQAMTTAIYELSES